MTDGMASFKWDPDSESYQLDLAFAACEWCVGILFVAYFMTLYPDFKVCNID